MCHVWLEASIKSCRAGPVLCENRPAANIDTLRSGMGRRSVHIPHRAASTEQTVSLVTIVPTQYEYDTLTELIFNHIYTPVAMFNDKLSNYAWYISLIKWPDNETIHSFVS